MKLFAYANTQPLNAPFAISRGRKTHIETVRVHLHDEDTGCVGRGEGVPYPRYGETTGSVLAQIEGLKSDIETCPDIQALQSLMPAGAARCAVDCAFWDLQAKLKRAPVWALAGLPAPSPLHTAQTISLDRPQIMARAAHHTQGQWLKLKLGTPDDLACLDAVHKARPDARLILDGNEGLKSEDFKAFCEAAKARGTVLIEQPFAEGADQALAEMSLPLPICADESAHICADIAKLTSRYQGVNIKLDKTGGLTEAIAMVKAAHAANMQIMIGCMVASSLSMAPAFLLAGQADFVDLDGPLWLKEDVPFGLVYDQGIIAPPQSDLWG